MAQKMNFGICRGCGAQIVWIRTKKGKSMPCNAVILTYKKVPGGSERIVTPDGEVVSGITGVPANEADGNGYTSHFATCRKASNFRR